MRSAREPVGPIYLVACLLLGGSAQGIWSNMLLQIAGVLIIAWAAATGPAEPLTRAARQLLWIVLASLVVVGVQLVPLPGSMWPDLGGREAVERSRTAHHLRPRSSAYENLASSTGGGDNAT